MAKTTTTKTKAAPNSAADKAKPEGNANDSTTTEGTTDAAQAAEMEGLGGVAAGAGDAGAAAGGAGAGDLGAAAAVQAEAATLVAGAAAAGTAGEAAAPAPAGAAVQAYRVLSPLEHDGELLQPGRDVLLTEDQAAPLLGHTVKVRTADDSAALQAPKGAAQAAEVRRQLYRVLSPLDHDGKRRQVGAELALTEDEAAPLLGHTVALKDG